MFLKERSHKSLSLVSNLIIFHSIQVSLLFKRKKEILVKVNLALWKKFSNSFFFLG